MEKRKPLRTGVKEGRWYRGKVKEEPDDSLIRKEKAKTQQAMYGSTRMLSNHWEGGHEGGRKNA